MAQSSFVVNNHAAVATTFLLQSQDTKVAKYITAASSLAEPRGAEISHDLKPTGSKGTDRHLVKFFIGRKTTDGLIVNVEVGSLQLSIPRDTAFTDTDTLDIVAFIKNYLTDANVALLVDGVTP